MVLSQLIEYWLTSLVDSDLSTIELTVDNHVRVSKESLDLGVLDKTAVEKIFKLARINLTKAIQGRPHFERGEGEEERWADVLIAPVVLGEPRRRDRSISPLWIPAVVSPDGRITLRDLTEPNIPWLPRQYLAPTNSSLVVGNLDDYASFTQAHSPDWLWEDKEVHERSEAREREIWREQYEFAWSLFETVAGTKWAQTMREAHFVVQDQVAILPADVVRGVSMNILQVYRDMLHNGAYPPLLQAYASLEAAPAQPAMPSSQWTEPAKLHTGSFQREFPLSPSQREALHHLLVSPPGSVLAVDGPPGTGKTTLLHSVVASLWVNAALRGDDPPIIVVSSTNNQAVTNVLDSLNRVGTLERWLPEPVRGFGLYLTNDAQLSRKAEQRGIPTMTRREEGFPQEVEIFDFVKAAQDHFLKKCSEFYGKEISSLAAAQDLLQGSLRARYRFMAKGIDLADTLPSQRSHLEAAIGSLGPPDRWADRLDHELRQALKGEADWKSADTAWRKVSSYESIAARLRVKLGMEKTSTDGKREAFLALHWPEPHTTISDEEITATIAERKNQATEKRGIIERYITGVAQLTRAEAEWQAWTKALGQDIDLGQLDQPENSDGSPNWRSLHNALDRTMRYQMFELAAHYWEGRWLASLQNRSKPLSGQRRELRGKRWHRYAMLTPCFVTTMHTGPGIFTYYDGEAHPFYESIDLLIVDEAGQVSPEVSGAMFALARQALVVGDVRQIEPVWGVTEAVDTANLKRSGVLNGRTDLEALETKGLMASGGSVMQMAQSVSLFQLPVQNGGRSQRGMFLAEHRRSVPEVIAYSNELAYDDRLRPLRPSIREYPLPHIGYAHLKGNPVVENGSRKNEREAEAIVQWLVDNRRDLEAYYRTPSAEHDRVESIAEIVGIVTPFVAQGRAIRRALDKARLGDIACGTVHTFQGGERPIILFSPVYNRGDGISSYFFDRGINMLNVAVSRAKDSFLVFGDMDIFDKAQLRKPSGLLAKFLFRDAKNELVLRPFPLRAGFNPNGSEVHRLDTLDRHVRALARAFERAQEKLVIVSPWLTQPAVVADGVIDKIKAAVARSVEVVIYADSQLNKKEAMERAVSALRSAGATVKLCHNIHSKIICIDDDVFIEGSFNWLSAARDGQFVRYDTSIIYQGGKTAEFIRATVADLDSVVVRATHEEARLHS